MTKIRADQVIVQEIADEITPINWDIAGQIGENLTIVSTATPAITALNETDIAFIDSSNDDLRTYRWNEDTGVWSQIGSDLIVSSTGNPAIVALNSTDIAFIDDINDDLRVYRWTEATGLWVQVGNDLNIPNVTFPTLAKLNSTDVAMIDATNDSLRTYSFDGTDWALVGNGLAIVSVSTPTLTGLNGTDVAYIDGTNDDLRTYRFDGTDWAQVGNDLNIPLVNSPTLTTLNGTDVAMINGATRHLQTYRFDGTDWVQVGKNLYISGILLRPGFTALNGTDIAFIDAANDQLRTYRCTASIGTVDVASITEARYSPSLESSSLEGWNLEGASLDLNDADVSAKITSLGGLHFSPNGTELYVIHNEQDDVFHYTLSVAWDLSTAVFANEKLAIAELTAIKGVHLDPTGTKMYLLGYFPGTVFQYTLSTAWSVSTATYDSVSYTIPTVTSATGFDFKADGSLLFMVNDGDNRVYAIRLLTPWDLSTALFRGDRRGYNFTGVIDGNGEDIAFSPDGRTMFMAGEQSDSIYSYVLSDPWNLYTMAYDGRRLSVFDDGLQGLAGIFVKPDGNKLYIAETGESTIFQYDISGKTNVSVASETEAGTVTFASQSEVELGILTDRIVTSKTLSNWNRLPTTQFRNEGYDLTNASFDGIGYNFSKADADNLGVYGMHFSPDGLNLYTSEGASTTPNVYQHILEIPFDIQSISSVQNIGLLEGTGPRGISMSPDGTKFFTVDLVADVFQYTLSVPFDITSATYDTVTYNPTTPTVGTDLRFRPDGLAFFILSNFVVNEFTISTPWDLTTTPVVGAESPSFGFGSLYAQGIVFNDDGTKLIAMSADHTEEGIFSYTMGTAWDVSTATYDNEFLFTFAEDENPTGIVPNADGTKMFIAGTGGTVASNDVISQYSTAGPASIVSSTETEEGVLELATQVEVDAGTDVFRAVTPSTLANWVLVPHNWIVGDSGDDFTAGPSANGAKALAIGDNASANSTNAVAIGASATVVDSIGSNSIAIGTNSDAGNSTAIAIGDSADSGSTGSIAIGDTVVVGGTCSDTVAIGKNITMGTSAGSSVLIGLGVSNFNNDSHCVAIGTSAVGNGSSVAIGKSANTATNGIAIGDTAYGTGAEAIGIGKGAQATSSQAIAIGVGIVNSTSFATKIGYGVVGASQSFLTVQSKGKLSLTGDEAQFVAPNYTFAGSPIDVPANSVEGGVIYDSTVKDLQVYDGTNWNAVGMKSPIYTLATLPTVVEGATIYVSDATGSSLTGSQCFGNVSGSPAVWVDVTTGVAVA